MSTPTHQDDWLDADGRAILEAYRAEETLPQDTQERVWNRLDGDGQGRGARQWGKVVAIALALAACIALVLLGVEALELRELRKDAVEAAYQVDDQTATGVATERQAVSRRRPSAAERPEEVPEEELPVEEPPEPESKRPRDTEPPSTPEVEDPIARENAFFRSVQNALRADNPAHALALLDTWEREIEKGTLDQERSALRAVALCEAGKEAQGRPLARAFLREYPSSALAARVRKACGVQSTPADHELQRPRTMTEQKRPGGQ